MTCGENNNESTENQISDSMQGKNTELSKEIIEKISKDSHHVQDFLEKCQTIQADKKNLNYYSQMKANGTIEVFTNTNRERPDLVKDNSNQHIKTTHHPPDNNGISSVTIEGKDGFVPCGEAITLESKPGQEVNGRDVIKAENNKRDELKYNYFSGYEERTKTDGSVKQGQIHVYSGLKGEPVRACDYPHVHTVFQPLDGKAEGRVDITGSKAAKDKVGEKVQIFKQEGDKDVDGKEAQKAIDEKAKEIKDAME